MPIKCYYNQCPRHDNEGPFCYEGRCRAIVRKDEWVRRADLLQLLTA